MIFVTTSMHAQSDYLSDHEMLHPISVVLQHTATVYSVSDLPLDLEDIIVQRMFGSWQPIILIIILLLVVVVYFECLREELLIKQQF